VVVRCLSDSQPRMTLGLVLFGSVIQGLEHTAWITAITKKSF